MKELYLEVEMKMKGALDHFHDDLKHLRTGQGLVDYARRCQRRLLRHPNPHQPVAKLSVPEPTLIVAQPLRSLPDSGDREGHPAGQPRLNPSNDGKIVRLPVPPLTEERRKEIVKKAHDLAEVARNSVRQSRREGNERLKQMEKDHEIGQDDEHRGMDEHQKLHDHYIGEINQALENKEEDLMTV